MKVTELHRWQISLIELELANILGTLLYWRVPHRPGDIISTIFAIIAFVLAAGYCFLQIGYRIGLNVSIRVLKDKESELRDALRHRS